MNTAVVAAYVPPPNFLGGTAFFENITRWRTRFPLILFSEYDYGPNVLRLKVSPEIVKAAKYPNGVDNVFSISNLLFLTAMGMLNGKGFTHVIYVESDCRVRGHEWDGRIWDEATANGRDPMAAGSVVCYSVGNAGIDFCRAWARFMAQNAAAKFPIPPYGGNGSAEVHEPCVFTNGALGLYKLSFVKEVFGDVIPGVTDTASAASTVTAWDYALGRYLYRTFKEQLFSKLVHLDCVYSGYGDGFTTPEQRQQWLLNGEIVGVHQIKSEWPGPMESVHGNLIDQPSFCDPSKRYTASPDNPDDTLTAAHGMKIPSAAQMDKMFLTAPGETSTSPIDPRPVIVASGEVKATTPEPGAVVPSGKAADTAPVQTRKDSPEHVASDKQAAVPSAVSAAKPFKFRVDILIVTHAHDAKWLAMALKSIGKFCTGFGEIVVVFPKTDMDQIHPVLEDPMTDPQFPFDIRPVVFDQAEGKGHLHHMAQKCMADIHCPDADLVLHTDSDCVFFKPTTPQDYMHSDKPVVLMTPYDVVKERHRGHYQWKAVTEAVFKEPVHYSTMESHPSIWWREHYSMMRTFIETRQGMKFVDYVLAGSPTFPYNFCEFVALGTFALRTRELVERYHFINLARQPRPDDHLIQFWSHSGLDTPQEAPARLPAKYRIEADGTIIPREIIENILQIKPA